MGLLITLYLITCNVYGTTKGPPNRGFSYIEKWIAGVQCNILFAILEYFFILALKQTNLKKSIKIIDLISLIVSSLFFSFFNLAYWLYNRVTLNIKDQEFH